jgi:hypothetical protein
LAGFFRLRQQIASQLVLPAGDAVKIGFSLNAMYIKLATIW